VVIASDAEVALPDGVHAITMGRQADFAEAANRGIQACTDGAVLLLNDDTIPRPDFVERLGAAVTGPGIYQPRILFSDGSGRIENTGHRLFLDGFNLARGRGETRAIEPGPCGAFSGAAVLFTPEVLATIGVFDEDFGAFGEDLDLSLRAIRHGFPITHVADAVVEHALGATYGRTSARKIYLVERNRTRAAVRSLPLGAVAALPATTATRLTLMAAATAAGRGLGVGAGWKGAAAALVGIAAGMADIPDALKKRRADQASWTRDDRQLWQHLWSQRVRLADLWGPRINA
jgi:GT2 family glycosyltransferase